MTPSELRILLAHQGRRPLGKLVQFPLKQEGKTLFADIFNGRAYSYFLVDPHTGKIKEGHIYKHYNKNTFGVYAEHKIA